MVKKSLNIIQKKNRKNFYNEIPKKQKSSSGSSNILILGASGDGSSTKDEELNDAVNDSTKTDTQIQNTVSSIMQSYETTTSLHNMDQYITDMIATLSTTSTADTSVNGSSSSSNNAGTTTGSTGNEVTASAASAVAWDPRMGIVDYFKSSNDYIIPFASATAASAFYDEVFTIEKGVYEASNTDTASTTATSTKSGQSSAAASTSSTSEEINNTNAQSDDKVPTSKSQVSEMKNDANSYGVQSLMNPYCVTKLVGGLSKGTGTTSTMTTHMYDIRDTKRFYDNASNVLGESIVTSSSDVTSINNPTTTNIITWSNQDHWGRTPYSFQDFVFCKYWNIIPNNRLITFRKYAVPTYDNLNFPNMVTDDGKSAQQNMAAPIATVVTYFGGDSANKLNDFLKFTTGTKWKDVNADVHKVSGDTGSNPRAVIDQMFESGGFGGQGSASNIVNAFLKNTGGLTGQYLSFGKFVGLLDPAGYTGNSQKAWENMTTENMDPMDNLYSNKIIGPVNRVQSVKARDAGIEFGQSFNLTCEYVARPIGGINTKAAMLDILANCMEIASPEAVFWGGGHRFMIKPHMYPFRGTDTRSRIMDELYKGNIFGKKGAIAAGLQGFLDFGSKNASTGETGSFSWTNVTQNLGNVLSQTVGAIGNMLQSISSSLFGESSTLSSWLKKGTDALVSDENQQAGTDKLNSMFSNLNKMWKDKVIQETTMPNIQGMKAILSGEPTGNWHMTLGNPLNPIMVVGNLICTKMDVTFGEELGPDDFPLEMKVVYTIEHAMARDKAGIQSMFNRGSGKIYKLPDYVKALSDYETSVDPFTGGENVRSSSGWVTPEFMKAGTVMSLGSSVNGYATSGYQVYKITGGKSMSNSGNANTTVIAKFTPVDPDVATQMRTKGSSGFLATSTNRAVFRGNLFTRKRSNN